MAKIRPEASSDTADEVTRVETFTISHAGVHGRVPITAESAEKAVLRFRLQHGRIQSNHPYVVVSESGDRVEISSRDMLALEAELRKQAKSK